MAIVTCNSWFGRSLVRMSVDRGLLMAAGVAFGRLCADPPVVAIMNLRPWVWGQDCRVGRLDGELITGCCHVPHITVWGSQAFHWSPWVIGAWLLLPGHCLGDGFLPGAELSFSWDAGLGLASCLLLCSFSPDAHHSIRSVSCRSWYRPGGGWLYHLRVITAPAG